MANAYKTLADLVIVNDQRDAGLNVSDVLNDSPVLKILPAHVAPETTWYYSKYITAPTVGFRSVNDGRENSKSVDLQVTKDLKILDASFAVDKAIADGYRLGGASAYVGKEAVRHLQQAFFRAEVQFFYGTQVPGAAAGFTGLANETELDNSDASMVVNAGGTTNSVATSVWLLRATPDDAAIVVGNGGQLSIGETTEQRIAGATGFYPGYWTAISAWLAAQRGGVYSAVRIANITTDTGEGLTDDLIAQAIEKFPAGRGPTHIVCNRRSLRQLQDSRTTYSPTGAPAPFPQNAFDIPIILTDALVNTETLLPADS